VGVDGAFVAMILAVLALLREKDRRSVAPALRAAVILNPIAIIVGVLPCVLHAGSTVTIAASLLSTLFRNYDDVFRLYSAGL
jgi:hypothetical protein